MIEKIKGIPAEFLALSDGTQDEDQMRVAVLSFRGLDPEQPFRASNILLSASSVERLASDLQNVVEKMRRMRLTRSGPSDNPPLNKFLD